MKLEIRSKGEEYYLVASELPYSTLVQSEEGDVCVRLKEKMAQPQDAVLRINDWQLGWCDAFQKFKILSNYTIKMETDREGK